MRKRVNPNSEKRSFGDSAKKKSFTRDNSEGKRFDGFKKDGFDKKPGFDDRKRSDFSGDKPKRSFGNREEDGFDRKPKFGDKRGFGSSEDRPKRLFGNRKEGGFDRKRFDDKRGSGFSDDRPKRSFGRGEEGGFDRKPRFDDKRRSGFSDDKPKRSFGRNEEKSSGSERRFERRDGGFDRRRDGERREEGRFRKFDRTDDRSDFKKRTEGDRRKGGRFDNASFDRKRGGGDFNERRDSGRFEKKFAEEKQGFERNREDRKFDRRDARQGFERRDDRREERPSFDRKPRFEDNREFGSKRKFGRSEDEKFEYGKTQSEQRRPDYSEENLLSKIPAKKLAKLDIGEESETLRLNKYISNSGLCSRREADDLIASGQITVNGETITEMGYQVKPSDVVKYGRKILNREKLIYLLLNKPKDFITTTEDPEGRRTVMELVSKACPERIYPVGRLDRATTGLLLFTNDGELADKLSHPSNEIRKIYQVEIDKPLLKEDFEKLAEGVELEDGFIKPDEVSVVTPDSQVIGIEIHSGKNRVVRRIFENLGYEVTKLDRTTYAGLTKKDLPRGNWRFLTEKEVIRLKYMI